MSRLIHKKRTEAEKNGDKDVKTQYGLMSSVVYGKTMETLRNRIYVTAGVAIEEFVGIKQRCIHICQIIIMTIKERRA